MRVPCISTASGVMLGLLITLAFGGCTGSTSYTYEGPKGQVSGKVTYQGQPVTEGQVIFFSARGGAIGELGEGGAYSLSFMGGTDVPVGGYKVSITPPKGPAAPGEEPPPTVKHPMIPEKYQLGSTSGLMASVKEGQNNFDFNME